MSYRQRRPLPSEQDIYCACGNRHDDNSRWTLNKYGDGHLECRECLQAGNYEWCEPCQAYHDGECPQERKRGRRNPRIIDSECLGGGGQVTLSHAEALQKWYRCPQCGRILKIRVNTKEGWPQATIPRHSYKGPGAPQAISKRNPPVPKISPREARERKLFGPVYHGSTSQGREAIARDGFKVFRVGEAGKEHGFDYIGVTGQYGTTGYPPPMDFLGYGVYFTTCKAIAKRFNNNSLKGLKTYYLDIPRMETINFGAPNTIMKWWRANGYDFDPSNRTEAEWQRATENLTATLASKWDGIWYKGKGLRSLLDGDQVVVFDPSRVYELDTSRNEGIDLGTKVVHKVTGQRGTVKAPPRDIGKEYLSYHPQADPSGDAFVQVKWDKGGTDYNVYLSQLEEWKGKRGNPGTLPIHFALNPNYNGPKGRNPKFEVFAPPGYTFNGPHSFYAWTKQEGAREAAERGLTRCLDPECDCREGVHNNPGTLLPPDWGSWARSMKAAALVEMRPDQFLDLTAPLKYRDKFYAEAKQLEEYEGFVDSKETIIPPYITVDLTTQQVTAHEGRHRAAALRNAGKSSMPVVLIPRNIPESVEQRKMAQGWDYWDVPYTITIKDFPSKILPQFEGGYPVTTRLLKVLKDGLSLERFSKAYRDRIGVKENPSTPMTFERAIRTMPKFITGVDPLAHDTIDDLIGVVQLQMDLFDEDDYSDIRSRKQYEQCARWIQKVTQR